MKRIFLRMLTVIFLIFYVILASRPIYPGTAMVQRWSIDVVAEADMEKEVKEGWVPFLVKDFFGYADPSGEETFSVPLQAGVALGSATYCSYDQMGNNLVINDPFRDMLYPVDVAPGYPHWKGGLYFVPSHDMTGVSVLNGEGDALFTSRFATLLTSLDCGDKLIGFGLLNGEAHLSNLQGDTLEILEPGGSRIDAVYGIAVSKKDAFVAIVHGIDPQIVSLYRAQDDTFRRVKSFTLRDAVRSQVVMGFSGDGRSCLVKSIDGFELIGTLEPYTRRQVPLKGELVDYLFSADGKNLFVLSREGEGSVLYRYTRKGHPMGEEHFKGTGTWLEEEKGTVFLGVDNTLTRIDVLREEL